MADDMSDSEMNSCEFVNNGLLFFIFNKVDCMNHDDLVSVCMDFYKESEVALAVSLMFSKYQCPEDRKEHRGAKKKENDIRQIVSFMSQKPEPRGIKFCITKCTQVPPVTTDHVDMATVLKLFSSLRSEVKMLSSSNSRLTDKVARLEEEKQPSQSILTDSNRTPAEKGMSEEEVIRRQENLLNQFKKEQQAQKSFATALKQKTGRCHSTPPIPKGPPSEPLGGQASNGDFSRRNIISEDSVCDDVNTNDDVTSVDASVDSSDDDFQLQPWQRKKIKQKIRKNEKKSTVKKYPKKGIVIGTNEGTGVTAAEPLTNLSLFISRLNATITDERVKTLVSNISKKMNISVEKLETEHDNYASYKVTIHGLEINKISSIFQPENWPKGILVKKWYDKKSSE